MRVLVLSCNTGGGHNSCAAAIQEAFADKKDICDIADSLQFVSGKLSRFMSWGHTTMYRHIPKLFNFGYGFAEKHPGMLQDDAAVYKLLTSGTEQLQDYLRQGNYDTVICTHVFSGLLLSAMLREYPMALQTAFVATDYTCSPGAAASNLDVYFIPSAVLEKEFIDSGVPKEKLVASGMPISNRFYEERNTAKAKAACGIAPEHTHLLMMCGSMGCGPMKELTALLSQRLSHSSEISIVCGTNEKLYETLSQDYAVKSNIHILGFVKNMPELMDSADLYLTKPGGLSTSEAFAKKLPMVFIDAVAGCEEYNLRHFVNMGAAVTASTVWELTELCLQLLDDADRRRGMEAAMSAQEHKNASECICSVMHNRRGWEQS